MLHKPVMKSITDPPCLSHWGAAAAPISTQNVVPCRTGTTLLKLTQRSEYSPSLQDKNKCQLWQQLNSKRLPPLADENVRRVSSSRIKEVTVCNSLPACWLKKTPFVSKPKAKHTIPQSCPQVITHPVPKQTNKRNCFNSKRQPVHLLLL